MEPLSEILTTLKAQYGITLYPNNLTKRTLPAPDGGQESMMDRLARMGLAEYEAHGRRGNWRVSPDAIAVLKDLATEARPGRPPGAKVTLTADQTAAFLAALPAGADPATAVRTALVAATGWKPAVIDQVELIGLRIPSRGR